MLLTHFFAEFYGLFLIIFSISMIVHKEMYMELIRDLEHKRSTIYVLSIIGLLLGLLTILLHNVWNGNLLDVLVSLVGWVILLKSVAYLALPNHAVHKLVHAMALAKNYHLYTVISLLIGAYLALNGLWG